jgi:hypothetical protein
VLADDDEAVAFAQRIVRELIRSDQQLYATWIAKITEKECTVASMPFASDATATWRRGICSDHEAMRRAGRLTKETSVCVVNENGQVVFEGKAKSAPGL